jgi:hypothetical protein
MNTRVILRLLAAAALAGGVTAIFMQRSAAGRFNEENQTLREQEQESASLAQENALLPGLHTNTMALETLRAEAREIDKLRAEVWKLRPQAKDRDQLIAENARLAASAKAPAGSVSRLAEMPGYIAAESFIDAGLATPENAMQTFLQAVKQSDWKRLFECLTPETAGELRDNLNKIPAEARAKTGEEMLAAFRLKGYRISGKEAQSEDRVVLSLQTSAEGAPHPMTMRRLGGEWKLAL